MEISGIVVKLADNKEVMVSLKEARELYNELNALFGRPQAVAWLHGISSSTGTAAAVGEAYTSN